MRRYSIMYFISQSVKGLWRNGVMTLASIVVLMSCLVVMGSFALVVMNLNENLNTLGDMNEMVAFVELEKTEEEISAIREKIATYDNIKKIEYVSKEQALEEEKKKYEEEYPEFFEGISGDIYPASFVITYKNNDKVETLKYDLEHTEGVYKVNSRADIADTIETMKKGIIYLFAWFLAVLFVVSVFVIVNTIKLAVFARRQEISIMRYIGATNWFIMIPFVLEGVWIGLLSSGISFGIVTYVYSFVQKTVISDYGMFTIIPFANFQGWLLLSFVVIGVITGIMGSSISLRKHLKA
ncbi:MAG: ABC transporter permease [Ruminococcaceae bacterium]|nr:ABC transporter permease [Oscillospiraceae bacterium]